MTDSNDIDAIAHTRNELGLGHGVELRLTTARGQKRLMLIPSTCWLGTTQELLICLEGYSTFFFTGERSLNQFQLVTHGMPLDIATKVAEFIGRVMLSKCRTRYRIAQSAQPLPQTRLLQNHT